MLTRGVLIIAIWFSGALIARAAEYRITDLGDLGGTLVIPLAINNAAQVVGRADLPDDMIHAFYFDGQMHDLGPGQAYAINDHGAVAIDAGNSIVVWTSSAGHTPLGFQGVPSDINNSGQVAGYGEPGAFVFTPNETVLTLPTLGGVAVVHALNNSGYAVGFSRGPNYSIEHAVLYRDGTIIDLGVLGDSLSSYAADINSHDQVVGGSGAAFVWDDANGMRSLGELGVSSDANAINDSGTVVGNYLNDDGLSRGFVWDSANGMRDLNTLIPTNSGWTIAIANDINNQGQIVGWGNLNGESRGFLLTPIPEPAAMALALAGLGALTIFARQGR